MGAYFAIFSILSEMDFNSMGTWLNHFRWFSLILSSIEATSWKKKTRLPNSWNWKIEKIWILVILSSKWKLPLVFKFFFFFIRRKNNNTCLKETLRIHHFSQIRHLIKLTLELTPLSFVFTLLVFQYIYEKLTFF